MKSIEFDHNGVCPNGDKYFVVLLQQSSQFCLWQCRQKVDVKNLSKWCASLASLFLFSKLKTALKLDKLGRSYLEKSFGIKCPCTSLVVKYQRSIESSLMRLYEFRAQ